MLVATDASFLVKYFTRFTEEGFSCLISFIFIYDAFKKMLKLAHYYPINSEFRADYVTQYDCLCMAPAILGKTLASLMTIANPLNSGAKTEGLVVYCIRDTDLLQVFSIVIVR